MLSKVLVNKGVSWLVPAAVRNTRCFSAAAAAAAKGKLEVFGAKYSQPSRSVILLCEAGKIPYELVPVDPIKGEARKPEFRAMNPTALVPCIRETMTSDPSEEPFVLSEGAAIMQYLCNTNPASLGAFYYAPPAGSSLSELTYRARNDFWLSWHHHNTRVATRKVLLPHVFVNAKSEALIAEGTKSLNRSLALLDAHFATTGQRFLTNNEHISIADLLLLPELDQLRPNAHNLMEGFAAYPNVNRWMDDCAAALGDVYTVNFDYVMKWAARTKAVAAAAKQND